MKKDETKTGVIEAEEFFHEAEEEKPKMGLWQHEQTIMLLRSKHWTFREIAEWFTKRGVSCDHNTVFRVANKMPQA